MNQGHQEFPFWKRKIPPRQRKNSRKFPFGKMLDFARSNTYNRHSNYNIYLNQLQWYGQFAEVFMLLEVFLKSRILPKCQCHQQLSIRPTCRDGPAAIDHRSVVSTVAPRPDRRLQTLPPLRTSSLEHLPSQAHYMQNLDVWPIRIISASSFV